MLITGSFSNDQYFTDGTTFNFSSGSYAPDAFVIDAGISGSPFDPYRYPVLEQEVIEDLWKCHCGRVHKVSEELVCECCGSPITEKSRFVLE